MPAILTNSKLKQEGKCLPCEERAGGHSPSEDVRLSIAHTDSLPPPTLHPNTFRTWPKAALAMIPAGENRNPNLSKSPPKRGIRGKITTLSAGARRRIKETLSKIANVPAFTMALTLPEECAPLSPEMVHRAFLSICRNFTASTMWADVGLVYKREFMKNGRLHYHFVAYGLTSPEHARRLQWWMTMRWIRLILADFPIDSPVRDKMHKVHMHPKNMERVRSSIASYFAKYLGKCLDAPPVEVPGKWWGMINSGAIPFVEEKQLILPDFVRDRARRMARKLQAKRIQHGLFVTAMNKAGLVVRDDKGRIQPVMSLQQFNQARHPIPHHLPEDSPRHNILWCHQEMRKKLIESGYRSGVHNRPRPSSFGKITLVGYGVPSIAAKMIRHAADMWKAHRETNPF